VTTTRWADALRRTLFKSHAEDRRIALGFLWVSLFVLVGKVAGAAKEMAVAWRYGVSAEVDAYVIVFNFVQWPVSLWLNVLTVALVPVLVRAAHETPGSVRSFRGELLAWNCLLAAAFAALAWGALPALLRSSWFSVSPRVLPDALEAAKVLALVAPAGMLCSYFGTLLMAQGHYRNTLLEALPSATLLVAVLAGPDWIPAPLLWGTVLGFLLQASLLAQQAGAREDLKALSFGFRSPPWRALGTSVLVMVVGQAIASLSVIVDQVLAARVGAGAASSLSYANRVMALLLGIGAVGISRATLHVFSEVQQRGASPLWRLAARWAAIGCAAGTAVALACWLAAPLLIALLFERGAFTAADTAAVSHLLRIYTAQLPFYFGTTVLMNYLAARHAHRAIALTAVAALAAKLAFIAVASAWPPVEVLAASTGVFTFAWFLAMLLAALRSRGTRAATIGR
jgi:peptidoglycan biosynthesis protein MviN/MurJ (putative lipid II flippase)